MSFQLENVDQAKGVGSPTITGFLLKRCTRWMHSEIQRESRQMGKGEQVDGGDRGSAHLDRIDNSMAPPHLSDFWIHWQYSLLGRPRKPSVKVSGSAATVSAMTCLHTSPLSTISSLEFEILSCYLYMI